MMSKPEIGKLLLFASGLDRFVQVDAVTVDAWFRVLSDAGATYAQAEQACINHYTGPDANRPFTVAHVVALVAADNRSSIASVASDVRSAKARLLIDKRWPEREPLPADVRDALLTLRERENRVMRDLFDTDQIGSPIDVGIVGRLIP